MFCSVILCGFGSGFCFLDITDPWMLISMAEHVR
jgi:hypothetical protein